MPQEIRKTSNNLTLCPKEQKKNKENPSWEENKTIRGDKWIKNWKTDKIKETNSWFFEEWNKTDKPLNRLNQEKKKGEGPNQ